MNTRTSNNYIHIVPLSITTYQILLSSAGLANNSSKLKVSKKTGETHACLGLDSMAFFCCFKEAKLILYDFPDIDSLNVFLLLSTVGQQSP